MNATRLKKVKKIRVENAYYEVLIAFQDSHHTLMNLVDFLCNREFYEFLKSVTGEFINNHPSLELEINKILNEFIRKLEKARIVREQTSNINEEFQRAMANFRNFSKS